MAEAIEEKVPVPAGGFPIKIVVLIALMALVLGIGGGVALTKLSGSKSVAEQSAGGIPSGAETHAAAKPSSASNRAPGVIYDLDPFIVNLADSPESRYLKLTLKLELDRPGIAEDLTPRLPLVRDAILTLLSSKEAAGLKTAREKLQLHEEIAQRINSVLPQQGVRSVYFTEFLVQ